MAIQAQDAPNHWIEKWERELNNPKVHLEFFILYVSKK